MARIIARLNIGGPAIQAVLLTRALPSESFASVLVTGVVGNMEGDMTPLALEQGVQPVIISDLGREISWKNDLAALWELIRTLRRIRPDIVHTHTAKAGFLGRMAALLVGVPVKVHTFHGHVFHGYFSQKKTAFFLALERLLARLTDCLVVVSERQREELATTYRVADASKFRVIPLGFDLDPFLQGYEAETVRHEFGLPRGDDRCIIGFSGRLVPIKNPFLLVQALARVKGREPGSGVPSGSRPSGQFHVVIVGGGELEKPLKHRVKEQGLEGDVTFLGWRKVMAPLYAGMDVVALTSSNEGTPVALIEGMAAGKPFVATDVGGIADMTCGPGHREAGELGGNFTRYDNGILVPPDDVEAFASALLWISRNQEAASRMGERGRAFALSRFSRQRLVDDMQALYLELLKRKTADVVAA